MYESPIKIIESTIDSIYKDIAKKKDDAIFAKIQSSFGVDVDRQELMRALQYDRNQYDKGYEDGKRDAVKHGRWTDIYDFGNDECAGHCSNCRTPQKAQNFTALIAGHRYCRWCGARMDGDGQ